MYTFHFRLACADVPTSLTKAVHVCVCVYTHVILVTLYLSLIHNVTFCTCTLSLRIHGFIDYTSMTYTTCAFAVLLQCGVIHIYVTVHAKTTATPQKI